MKQFLCLKLFTKKCATPAFLFVAYYAPLGAPIYQRLGSGEDPLSALTEAVIAVHELGPVWVVGDFNSRVGDAQSLELNEEGVAVWRNFNADESWCRSAEDKGRNGMSEFFMQFAAAGGLTIINGTSPFPDTQSATCRTHNGSSTMDFLLACKSARDRILDFSFGPFSPESDHRPLRCTLMGFEREIRRQYRRSKVGVCLDVTKRHQYETTLMNKLHGRELTSGTLANIITGVAKEVFTAKLPRDKGWFDKDCRVARSKAMSAVDQRTAFRQYNNFIRARKRRFIRQHQRVLGLVQTTAPKAGSAVQPDLAVQLVGIREGQGTVKAAQIASLPDLNQVMLDMEGRLKGIVEDTRASQATLVREREDEQTARYTRRLNLRVVGLEELEEEDTKAIILTFFRDTLRVHTTGIEQAIRVGRNDKGQRAILVKFSSLEDRSLVLSNRSMLKGLRIWVDPDLTPSQMTEKNREFQRVKSAWAEGFVAYMRDGHAVITTRRKDES
ncbi:hypothetical protein R1sor_014120 [Riccia sorocarpa]|uniref:Endonuclease/exonuclease/phosphatase domain-containing protein n=1 Tax=Riccia sorocarpa TaxID=122646 RepID=A0ABD3HAF0_9MARC